MSSIHPAVVIDSAPSPRAWLIEAWAVMRNAPLPALLLPFLAMLFEGVLQLLPGWGVLLSKLLTPLVSALALIALHGRVETGTLRPRAVLRAWLATRSVWPVVIAASFSVFVTQVLAAAVLAGGDAAMALAHGAGQRLLPVGAQRIGLIMASGVIATVPWLFLFPALLLQRLPLRDAWRYNVRALRRQALPVACFTLLSACGLYQAVQSIALLFFYIPLMSLLMYSGWRVVVRDVAGA